MDATCTIQDSIHVFRLVHKYVSRILGTYQKKETSFLRSLIRAQSRNRTSDTRIFSPLLYQLSYLGGWRPGTDLNRRPLA